MIALKLAYRNLVGAGIRTWLSVSVLAFTFILIIMVSGLIEGWNKQATTDMKAWEVAQGQYWYNGYDPYDIFTLEDSHGKIPAGIADQGNQSLYAPVLISQATIYPQGRMRTIVMKGIDPDQGIIKIPTSRLKGEFDGIPVLIGTRMARACKLNVGDVTTIRWRDKDGTFDAAEMVVADIFKTTISTVDVGQAWIPLDVCQEIKGLPGEATIIITSEEVSDLKTYPGWEFKDNTYLMSSVIEVIKTKSASSSFLYMIFLGLGLLAVFDTQVLSIFRRQKEIGTYIAMGMTRTQVVKIFTVEGTMHSFMAVIVGAIVGTPFFAWFARSGIDMSDSYDSFGMAIADKMYPSYGIGLIISTVILVILTTTIVSYLPSRKISKMNPTEALRGKVQ
jgi:putative ABC transport system permease protein